MQIAVLAIDGVFDTGLATVLDAFNTANELADLLGLTTPGFDIRLVSTTPQPSSALGMLIPARDAGEVGRPDWVIVPALGCKMPDPLIAALGRADVGTAIGALRWWADGGASIAAACVGTFVLAESGLLDGHEATTTWWLTPLFRERYRDVRLDADRLIVPSGRHLTAGAALSHVDLALWLIRGVSPELAGLVANYLIVDSRPSQWAYVISDHLAHADPLVQRFDRWVRERLGCAFVLDEIAGDLATTKRTLTRRIRQATGKSPLSYVRDLRIERAVHLLKTSRQSVEAIAADVGYSDGVTLRTLLRRRLGKGVRELRGLA